MPFLIDYWYIILVVPAVIVSLIADARVKSAYARYAKVANRRGMTGREAAERILRQNGITDVSVVPVKGELTDHFDPQRKIIALSEGVYGAATVAAVGIAAHEAGHACQHSERYAPIGFRNAIVPVVQFASKLSTPLILIGLIFAGSQLSDLLVTVGVLLYGTSVLFHLVTLPVEFDASRRAVKVLDGAGLMSDDELKGTKSVLRAAAMTYVASMLVSLMSFIRLILITGSRRRRR